MQNNVQPNNIHEKLIDYELAKRNNKNSKVRRYLPVFAFGIVSYYSFLLALGMAAGYIGSKIFSKYFIEKGRVSCIFLNCGKKYKIHLHHWILGAIILLAVWVIDFFYLPRFFLGVVIGIIIDDIYDFNDWHKILVKKEAS